MTLNAICSHTITIKPVNIYGIFFIKVKILWYCFSRQRNFQYIFYFKNYKVYYFYSYTRTYFYSRCNYFFFLFEKVLTNGVVHRINTLSFMSCLITLLRNIVQQISVVSKLSDIRVNNILAHILFLISM